MSDNEAICGELIMQGNIHTVDDPAGSGASKVATGHPMAILVQFESIEDIRRAVADGRCTFTWR
ncbi:MAG: hypothetical protein AAGI72_06595 [Pseudomonadota bacterium]